MAINLVTLDSAMIKMPTKIRINELHYKIEYNPDYNGVTLFIDVIDGQEKSSMIKLNERGMNISSLNPDNLFQTDNFEVEKITFNCFRKIELLFTLKRCRKNEMCE